ncbi:phosphoglycolate phosphatase [Spirilliplanes yamanashiensis]|uniref:Phosphoglycolate phosphatase n=1 Tax=Spirilliplanes yamanashiensis TaxID=42233 RepID=A0A8J4DN16_9ACTN|nr:phosphoglycolate phosphatase [Spirilliplanes yamanashiensis]
MRWYRAVALDLDGTLTSGGRPGAAVLDGIARLRDDGVVAALVTGRILAELDAEFPGLADAFDVVVAENGCVLRTADWSRRLAEPVDAALAHRLRRAGHPVVRGEVLLASTAAADHVALDAVEDLGLDVHLVRNRQALMLLPAGVSKGTGLRAALAAAGVSRHNTVAVGDAENDHPMLALAGLGVAVGNAVESLRRRADLVLPDQDGDAVAELLAGPVLTGERRVVPGRRQLVVGEGADGRPALLPAVHTTVLVSGGSDTGKSYLAGLLVEQLVAQEYAVLVLDPEGDHVCLGALPGVAVVAGSQPPAAADVFGAFERGASCVVLDMSRLQRRDREACADTLGAPLAACREATGLPHWVVIDEAQDVPWCRSSEVSPALLDPWGLCLVSYQPERVSPELLRRIGWRIDLSPGGRRALLSPPAGEPRPIDLARRFTQHVRHWHKYADSPLPAGQRFVFRGPGADGVQAGSLREFVAALAGVPAATVRHHALNGDFSRWVADVYRDHLLAGLIRTAERDLATHGDAGRTRRLLTELVAVRYLPPAPRAASR